MSEIPALFKKLIKISGGILFVIGLVLNILMLFFGIWPSLIYLLIMFSGAGIVFLFKDTHMNMPHSINLRPMVEAIAKVRKRVLVKSLLRFFKITFAVFIIIFISITLLFFLFRDTIRKRSTLKECQDIVRELKSYKGVMKEYPASLQIIIGSNPLRKDWEKDAWNHSYFYQIKRDSFLIISAGKDGVFGTEDDLRIEN